MSDDVPPECESPRGQSWRPESPHTPLWSRWPHDLQRWAKRFETLSLLILSGEWVSASAKTSRWERWLCVHIRCIQSIKCEREERAWNMPSKVIALVHQNSTTSAFSPPDWVRAFLPSGCIQTSRSTKQHLPFAASPFYKLFLAATNATMVFTCNE